MKKMDLLNKDYRAWLLELKTKIRSTQLKVAVTVNSSLIEFYLELGMMINEKQGLWGSRFLENLSKDLKAEFPGMSGFSLTNLKYCRIFYNFFSPHLGNFSAKKAIRPQPGDELGTTKSKSKSKQKPADILPVLKQTPWGHIKVMLGKIKNQNEAIFYLQENAENNWSRDTLSSQIKNNLYKRKGKAITNFKLTLPEPQSDLANETLKDPYVFDFMTMTKPYIEKDIENQLIKHITKFMLELGKGFAFVGQQYHIEVAENDYYIDLLFYHTHLKCYVVVELKNTKFIPEYAGKLNFYLSAIDSIVKKEDDKPSIGILLCKDKNNIEAEFALRDINKPIGVSEFNITEILPENLKSSLPTVEEIENELKRLE